MFTAGDSLAESNRLCDRYLQALKLLVRAVVAEPNPSRHLVEAKDAAIAVMEREGDDWAVDAED